MDIEVIEPRKSSTGRQISLRAKVHVREMRQASNIKSWRPRAMCGVGKGKELVVGERVHIKLQQDRGALELCIGRQRRPGDRPDRLVPVELPVENKLRRKLFVVKGAPAPAKIVVRETLNSRLGAGLEGKFLAVDKRLVAERNPWLPEGLAPDMDELLPGKAPQKELNTNRAKPAGQTRAARMGRHAIVTEHGDRLRIVAEKERPTFARTPPQRLLPKGELVVVKGVRDIGFEHASAGEAGDWPRGCRRGKVGCRDGGIR